MSPLSIAAARTAATHLRPGRSTCALLLGLALLGGCADRHNVEVGAIPDDYRTRHPIIVSEAEQRMEIPVTQSQARLPGAVRDRVREFADRFLASGAATIRVMLPSGSANAAAAELASSEIVATLKREGVRHGRILVQPYLAAQLDGPTPIRLSYVALDARTAPCGRWPADLGDTSENKEYFNFGCASQQNLAAQVADPRDLLGPRAVGEVDAERRTNMLDNYRNGQPTSAVSPSSEVNYNW